MRKVKVALQERSYDIHISNGDWAGLGEAGRQVLKTGKVLLVSDRHVYSLFGQAVTSALQQAGFEVTPAVIPPGEGSKTLMMADSLYTAAITAAMDRTNGIVALGGGVVGDLAGFVAATYLRGVPFIQIPTTLLAQVDSSVGGKVAVNHQLGKNLIGSFYQPKLVWIEPATLLTLPTREYLAGAAEVVKYGVIMSEMLLAQLEENWERFVNQDLGTVMDVVAACCALKAQIVAEDEKETDRRAILNFGHTIGHALEAATSYQHYLHGEAVLAGMVLAVQLAVRLSLLNVAEAKRLLRLFTRIGLRAAPPGLAADAVIAALQQDKKRIGSTLVFILPVAVGQVGIFNDVPPDEVRKLVTMYLNDHEGSLPDLAD